VIIIGAGKIGSALSAYRGFRQRGFRIVAVYDADPSKVGRKFEGFAIRDVAQLHEDSRRNPADIAVITVPAESAQEVADAVVGAGIKAVMNFAPVQLQVPDDVTVKTVNMAMELEGLSFALTNRD
jgi:redox-sensing transcriptional repressor